MKWPSRKVIVAGVVSLAALFGAGHASADATTDHLKTVLQTRLGLKSTIKTIVPSPVHGLYEVNLGNEIVYSDPTGDHIIIGDMIDTAARANMTEARIAELTRIQFARLPFNDAVKVVKGNGSRKIAVFSDPNCPYCKQLESTLKGFDNITVYTFLYPVLSPDSTVKAKSIWCSPDRARAWESWMVDRNPPTAQGTCNTTAVDRNLALGRSMNVTGTPTVFFEDGNRLPGAVPADRLEQRLAAIKH